MPIWILVANASRARLFSITKITLLSKRDSLQLINEFSHPESRKKDDDLVSDKLGHFHGEGMGSGDFVEASDPKEREAKIFADELSKTLEKGRLDNTYSELIVVSPPHFHGLLNQALNKNIHRLISKEIQKDYTQDPLKKLQEQLEHYFS